MCSLYILKGLVMNCKSHSYIPDRLTFQLLDHIFLVHSLDTKYWIMTGICQHCMEHIAMMHNLAQFSPVHTRCKKSVLVVTDTCPEGMEHSIAGQLQHIQGCKEEGTNKNRAMSWTCQGRWTNQQKSSVLCYCCWPSQSRGTSAAPNFHPQI